MLGARKAALVALAVGLLAAGPFAITPFHVAFPSGLPNEGFRIAFEDSALCDGDNFGVFAVVEAALARTVGSATLAVGKALAVHFETLGF